MTATREHAMSTSGETRYLVPFNESHSITVGTRHGDIEMHCSCDAVVYLPGLMHISEVMEWAGRHVGRLDPELEMTVVIEHGGQA